MTKVLGRALILSSLLMLAGCASRQDPVANGAPVVSTNAAVFDPTTGNVPLPNILATAEAADPLAGRAAATPMTPPEALAYINLHEVGGTNAVAGVNAPIYLQFTYPVDPTTVTAANIKVFQITPDAAGTENNPLGFTDVTGLFSFDYAKGGTDLWLFPNFPLTPGTRYLYVVTDRVLDAATEAPIIPSVYFQVPAVAHPARRGGGAAGSHLGQRHQRRQHPVVGLRQGHGRPDRRLRPPPPSRPAPTSPSWAASSPPAPASSAPPPPGPCFRWRRPCAPSRRADFPAAFPARPGPTASPSPPPSPRPTPIRP